MATKPAPAPLITHKDLALLTEKRRPFSAKGWVFELKHDGYRCLVRHAGLEVRFTTRNGTDLTRAFPELSEELAERPEMVIDGELVILDDQGRPQFDRLIGRAGRRDPVGIRFAAEHTPAALFAFDLLWLAGKDMRALPLLKRKAALKKALKGGKRILYLDHVAENGERLYAAVDSMGLEGIVAKRADSAYRAGRSKDWVKIKTPAGDAEQAKRGEGWNR